MQNGWMLILTTESTPYDEVLHITLLDQCFEILDQVELSRDMSPGIVKDVQVIDAKRMQFNFNRIDPYILEVDIVGVLLSKGSKCAKRDFTKKFGKKYLYIN